MRTLTSLFSVLALTLSLGCGSDDGDDKKKTPDATPATIDAMPTPDAMPAGPSAANLGKVCTQAAPCPGGEQCIILAANAANGFCSIACTEATASVCSSTNGFPGPGVGTCALSMGEGQPAVMCGVVCDQGNAGDTSCPAGLTCMSNLCIPDQPGA